MSELYWLFTLGNCKVLCNILIFLTVIASIIFSIACFSGENENVLAQFRKIRNVLYVIVIISTLGCVFIPSTKELYIIYGVGGTMDYLKYNPTAKQLPDKCIKALDKWIDEYTMNDDIKKGDK